MSKSCRSSCRLFDQCSSVDRVTQGADTKACHISMLVLERNALLEVQIDQRRACSWPFIKSFEWQIGVVNNDDLCKCGRVCACFDLLQASF